MNKKVIPFEVQLKQNNNYIVQGINQNDAGVIFDIKIMDGLEAFNFSGYSVITLKITKPDQTITVDSTGGARVDIVDAENGHLKINIPTSCTAQNGMHYCRVGFASDDRTLFDAMMFNYYVGDAQAVDDEDIIGTNEFPVLNNLIASVANALTAEQNRVRNEMDRIEEENERQESFEELVSQMATAIQELENARDSATSLLTQVYEAIAQGGSIDISSLEALATKTYLETRLGDIECGTTSTGEKTVLHIFRGNEVNLTSYPPYMGELQYALDTNKLFIGMGGGRKVQINAPCFVVSATAPTDTSLIWIDTSGSRPVIKVYISGAWTSCNTAVYA